MEKSPQWHIIFGEKQWKDKMINLDFTKFGKTHTFHTVNLAQNLLFKLLHYATKTSKYIYKISRDKVDLNPNCQHCNKTEDNLHLFTTCNRIQTIWTYFQTTYQKLTK